MITNYELFSTILLIVILFIVLYFVSYTIINCYKKSKGIKRVSIDLLMKRTKQRIKKFNEKR